MKEVTLAEFTKDMENYTVQAVRDSEFLKIRTKAGNAVLISEDEWNILVDAMKTMMTLGSLKKRYKKIWGLKKEDSVWREKPNLF